MPFVCQQTRGGGLCSGQHFPFREINSGVSLGAERASSGLEISSFPHRRMSSLHAPDLRPSGAEFRQEVLGSI